MAQFYAAIVTPRRTVTRLGHARHGLRVNLQGWTAGVEVVAKTVKGKDVFEVYRTGGSSGGAGAIPTPIATVESD